MSTSAAREDQPNKSRTFPKKLRPAAFFDLDKTVIAKSSALVFSRPLYRSGLI
ncbi:MAG: HAD-IB family hydrolase, partial [Actinomycetes bacterium]